MTALTVLAIILIVDSVAGLVLIRQSARLRAMIRDLQGQHSVLTERNTYLESRCLMPPGHKTRIVLALDDATEQIVKAEMSRRRMAGWN